MKLCLFTVSLIEQYLIVRCCLRFHNSILYFQRGIHGLPPTPTMTPNIELMYRASRRRITSGTRAKLQRPHTSTISRNRKRSKSTSESVESLDSRPRSQNTDTDLMVDLSDFSSKFDDNYSLSGKSQSYVICHQLYYMPLKASSILINCIITIIIIIYSY